MFGIELKRLRGQRGLTLRGLAKLAHTTASNLSQIESGIRFGSLVLAEDLDKVFGTGRYLAQLWMTPVHTPQMALQIGCFEMDRRDVMRGMVFMTGAAAVNLALPADAGNRPISPGSGVKVTADDVVAARKHLEALQEYDEQFGGARGTRALDGFLYGDMAEYCAGDFDTPQVRTDMFTVAAEAAFLRGWKAHDTGDDGRAQLQFRRAQTLAEESQGPGHDAWLLRAQALHGLDIGKPGNSVAAAEEAVRRTKGMGGHVAALMLIAAARCYAETGDKVSARQAIAAAGPHLNTDPDDSTPSYVSAWCPQKANLLTQTAHALTAMGAHIDAAQYFLTARDLWNMETHARVWSMDSYLVGKSQLAIGEEAEAERQWAAAIEVYDQVRSDRCETRRRKIGAQMPHLVAA